MRTNRTYRGITLVTATLTASLSLIGSASAQVIRGFPYGPVHRTSVPIGNVTMNPILQYYKLTGRPGLMDCGNSNLSTLIETTTRNPKVAMYGMHTIHYSSPTGSSVPGLLNTTDIQASYVTFCELTRRTGAIVTGQQINNQNTWRVPNGSSISASQFNMRESDSLPCADIWVDAWMGNPFGPGIRDPYYVVIDVAGNVISPTMCSYIRIPAPAGYAEGRRLVLPQPWIAGSYSVLIFIQGHLVEKVNSLAFTKMRSGSRGRTPVTPLHFRWGDANGDNVIDQIDGDVLMSMVATRSSLDTNSAFCEGVPGLGLGRSAIELDYNGDGVVDLTDFTIMAQYAGQTGAAGWPKHL
ncbi:MAG: dockerin type I repeat-containing protein [Armatimonadetes bacterium]|nr:dockerin type I repeat-containing protein [Armatimonadota bacterium]